MSTENEFPFFFTIATPLFFSGLIGLFTGIIPWHIFIALLVALYVTLCVGNELERGNRKR